MTPFDGITFDPSRDGDRLLGQFERVRDLMRDGEWRTLEQIAEEVGGTEASVSARLRDLRKPKFGATLVERTYVSKGLWKYRVDMHREAPVVQQVAKVCEVELVQLDVEDTIDVAGQCEGGRIIERGGELFMEVPLPSAIAEALRAKLDE